MEQIDSEFEPIRKAKGKVDHDRIIKDILEDHEQNEILKKITLLPVKIPNVNKTASEVKCSSASSKLDDEALASAVKRKPEDTQEDESIGSKRFKSEDENKDSESEKVDFSCQAKLVEPLDTEFYRFKHYLLRQLSQTLPPQETRVFTYLREVQHELDRMLKQAITQKESHSSIMIGPRGSYKTFLLNHEIALLSELYDKQFITIRLNGFIHSEQSAINGIATQLEQQLKLLSEDIEHSSTTTDVSSGSLTEVFEKILQLLDSSSIGANPKNQKKDPRNKITVIFIFDEIDTFAGPVRQTLLYNLFDMVEHARVPVCIFGCTTKLNILEHLEKRVKSRFSQRIIYMPQIESFQEYSNTINELLSVPKECRFRYTDAWNSYLKASIANEKSELRRTLKMNYDTFRSIPRFKNSVISLIFNAKSYDALCHSFDTCEQIKTYNNNQLQSSMTAKVKSLSDLELAILICAARTALKTKDETLNFNLAYAEYEQMIKALNSRIPTVVTTKKTHEEAPILFDSAIKLWKKRDVKNIWENLLNLNFLTERAAIGLRESAQAVFYASNYQFLGTTIPFDLRVYQTQIELKDLRRIVPKSSSYYSWTQL